MPMPQQPVITNKQVFTAAIGIACTVGWFVMLAGMERQAFTFTPVVKFMMVSLMLITNFLNIKYPWGTPSHTNFKVVAFVLLLATMLLPSVR